MKQLVVLLILALVVFHQDFWWRSDDTTLVFGFLPVSLAYHIGLSIAASILWGLMCIYCWPRGLDTPDASDDGNREPMRGGH